MRGKNMKVGNVILAIFLWLCIPFSFIFGTFFGLFATLEGDGSEGLFICAGLPSIILFILGLIILILGIEKDIPQRDIEAKSSIRFCPNCGRNIPFDANICPYCVKRF
jgi:hypothetical protein